MINISGTHNFMVVCTIMYYRRYKKMKIGIMSILHPDHNSYIRWLIGLEREDYDLLYNDGIIKFEGKVLGMDLLKILIRNSTLYSSDDVLVSFHPTLFVNIKKNELATCKYKPIEFKDIKHNIVACLESKENIVKGELVIGSIGKVFKDSIMLGGGVSREINKTSHDRKLTL